MSTYSHVALCPTLTPKEKCIRIREYRQGQFHERFHEHVPLHKLSEPATKELLRTLVLRYEECTAKQILNAYLTRRGKEAKISYGPVFAVDYPEPGVQRTCCGGNILASVDVVLVPAEFRKTDGQEDAARD